MAKWQLVGPYAAAGSFGNFSQTCTKFIRSKTVFAHVFLNGNITPFNEILYKI